MGHLAEIAQKVTGTYAAMWPTSSTQKSLLKYYKDKVPNLVDDFHVTTAYSRVVLPKLKNKTLKIVTEPDLYSYKRLGQNGEYLVLVVPHPGFKALWQAAINMGGTWDYPEYIPHISLSTNFNGRIDDIPDVPPFPLVFNQFKVDELKDD